MRAVGGRKAQPAKAAKALGLSVDERGWKERLRREKEASLEESLTSSSSNLNPFSPEPQTREEAQAKKIRNELRREEKVAATERERRAMEDRKKAFNMVFGRGPLSEAAPPPPPPQQQQFQPPAPPLFQQQQDQLDDFESSENWMKEAPSTKSLNHHRLKELQDMLPGSTFRGQSQGGGEGLEISVPQSARGGGPPTVEAKFDRSGVMIMSPGGVPKNQRMNNFEMLRAKKLRDMDRRRAGVANAAEVERVAGAELQQQQQLEQQKQQPKEFRKYAPPKLLPPGKQVCTVPTSR
jgi:hypothetical protein